MTTKILLTVWFAVALILWVFIRTLLIWLAYFARVDLPDWIDWFLFLLVFVIVGAASEMGRLILGLEKLIQRK